jgi:hypothetical protein
MNAVNVTQNYLQVKNLIERAKTVANLWSVEYRIKDFTKDCIKDGFSKDDIQLLFTIMMNEQWDVAIDELENDSTKQD